jgi:SAM-dependent methyltransferase
MLKDSDFYDRESSVYSSKRYSGKTATYIQFFFKKRLAITLGMLKYFLRSGSSRLLLEIGCADGIVLREIEEGLPNTFSTLVGIDISEDMVKVARQLTHLGKAAFYLRGLEPQHTLYDVVVEVGVANYADFDSELIYAYDQLKDDGVYIVSVAGANALSLYMGGDVGYKNFHSYDMYEDKIRKIFRIKKVIPVGLRLPLLWKMPMIARIVQPVLEVFSRPMLGSFFHEKIYFLKKIPCPVGT